MKIDKTLRAALFASVALLGGVSMAVSADIAVIAGSANDAFFNRIKKGVDDATLVVEANGGSVNYLTTQNYDNFGPDLVQLINTAASQGVDGIAIPVWVAESQVPALKSAADRGIKIMMYNSGADVKDQIDGINYFGTDEKLAGLEGAEYLAGKGAKKILCHIHVPGAVNLETRCDGVADGAKAAGIEIVRLPTPASIDSDVTGTSEALKAELIKDPTIDAIITNGAWSADAAAIAIQQAGRPVMLGNFDLSPAVMDRIKNGQQTMAIDQQPYAQAFLATTMLAAYIDFGIDLPTDPVLTGPGIVDSTNIEAALAGVEAGAR